RLRCWRHDRHPPAGTLGDVGVVAGRVLAVVPVGRCRVGGVGRIAVDRVSVRWGRIPGIPERSCDECAYPEPKEETPAVVEVPVVEVPAAEAAVVEAMGKVLDRKVAPRTERMHRSPPDRTGGDCQEDEQEDSEDNDPRTLHGTPPRQPSVCLTR